MIPARLFSRYAWICAVLMVCATASFSWADNTSQIAPQRRKARGEGIDVPRAVILPLSRSAGNILTELRSALEGNQYADAATILIASAPPIGDLPPAGGYPGAVDEGLVAAAEDDRLFVSFRVALRLLMVEHPELREAMVRQIGPADRLKIEQVLAGGDPAAVEALSLQYCGTPDAAQPCEWLGDRALAAIDLARAVSWYEEGLHWASPAQQPELAARKRLASAMLGSAWGQPPTQPLSLGGQKVSPERFEGWIRDQLSRRRNAAEVFSSADTLPLFAAPQPMPFQAASFGQLDGGERPDEMPPELRNVDFDWSWRRLTVRAGEDLLLAVEGPRITAFDLEGGKVRWQCPLHNGWSAGPVRPLLCGQRIYVRDAAVPGRAGVACLDGKTGRSLWLRDCGAGTLYSGSAASDPLWFRGRLFVITIGPTDDLLHSPVCLMELHAETGDVLSRQQLWETTQREKLRGGCQASWAGNRLVALVAGSVASIDLQGRIVWFRQEATLPCATVRAFAEQPCQPVIESDGRLFVQQPGSCAIDCLSLETGRRLWRREVIGLQRIVDLPDDRLLARTSLGLAALNKSNGEVLWQREFPGMLSALARTASGLVLAARQEFNGDRSQIEFLWIDPASGQSRARGLVPPCLNQPVFFGPIVTRGDRTWCGFGYLSENLASKAKAWASSENGSSYLAKFATTGDIPDAGSKADAGKAWATNMAHAADFALEWASPVTVAEVVYYGRTAYLASECFKDYELYLDGAAKPIVKGAFEMKHGPQRIKLPAPTKVKKITLKFLSSYGGPHPGASKIQVFTVSPIDAEKQKRIIELAPAKPAVADGTR